MVHCTSYALRPIYALGMVLHASVAVIGRHVFWEARRVSDMGMSAWEVGIQAHGGLGLACRCTGVRGGDSISIGYEEAGYHEAGYRL